MIDIPMRTSQPLDCNSILNINIPTQTNQIFARVFDTSVIKKVPLSLVIGLFFCQLFCFII